MQQDDMDFRPYQDDLDTDDNVTDPIMDEETDDPLKILQIPAEPFKQELDNIALDDPGRGSEDMRELIEDRDEEDMGDPGK
jgi:hypothetical protein